MEQFDLCVPCGGGVLNIRVGAIIKKDGRLLMAGSEGLDYLYTVGGRIKFGETAEQAVVREVFEETGARLAVDRLGFIHENFFYGEDPSKRGKMVYEISFFFYMKVPDDFAPVTERFTDGARTGYLRWVAPDEDIRMYPAFFKTESLEPTDTVRHLVTDER